MKLMHFNDFRLGVLTDTGVVDVTDLIADIPPVSYTHLTLPTICSV